MPTENIASARSRLIEAAVTIEKSPASHPELEALFDRLDLEARNYVRALDGQL